MGGDAKKRRAGDGFNSEFGIRSAELKKDAGTRRVDQIGSAEFDIHVATCRRRDSDIRCRRWFACLLLAFVSVSSEQHSDAIL